MTIESTGDAPRHDTHAVVRVVDYEPPARDVRQCLPPSAVPVRYPAPRITRRPPVAQPGAAFSPLLRPAAVFAEAALRRVLEVIDRRRPAAQLRPLLAAGLVDSVVAVNLAGAGHQAVAVLRRVRLQPVNRRDPGSPAAAAEVFGTYSRGRRIHAIACRVEQISATSAIQWQVVALHIG